MKTITNMYLNENKRYAEAVVVTLPAILNEGGGRAGSAPTYLLGGEDMVAAVIEADTIAKKVYLVVDEVLPTGITVDVTVGGVAMFTAVAVDALGLTASIVEDSHFSAKGTVVITASGTTNITTGKLRVIVDAIHPSLKNGQYAS